MLDIYKYIDFLIYVNMAEKIPKTAVSLHDVGTYLANLYGDTVEAIATRDNVSLQAVYQRIARARKAIDVSDVLAVVESSLLSKVKRASEKLEKILDRDLDDDKTGVKTTATLRAIEIIYNNTLKHYQALERERLKAVVDQHNDNANNTPEAILDDMERTVARMGRFISAARANQPVDAECDVVSEPGDSVPGHTDSVSMVDAEPIQPVNGVESEPVIIDDSVQKIAQLDDDDENKCDGEDEGGGGVAP